MSFLLHVGAQVICTHTGQATPTGGSPRVLLNGQPAVNFSHVYTIAGCTFSTPESGPKPCVNLQWTRPATRVFIEGAPAILSTSTGITIGPLGVQGTPQTVQVQARVTGQ